MLVKSIPEKNDTAIIIPLEPGTLKLKNLAKNAYKINITENSIAANPRITPRYNGFKEKLVIPLMNSKIEPFENVENFASPLNLLSRSY